MDEIYELYTTRVPMNGRTIMAVVYFSRSTSIDR